MTKRSRVFCLVTQESSANKSYFMRTNKYIKGTIACPFLLIGRGHVDYAIKFQMLMDQNSHRIQSVLNNKSGSINPLLFQCLRTHPPKWRFTAKPYFDSQ